MIKNCKFNSPKWKIIPYLYFILLSAVWFIGELYATQELSYFALGIMGILITQAIIQHKILGLILGLLAIVLSVVLFFAVFAEFTEFKHLSFNAFQLILVGSILSLSGLTMGFLMTQTKVQKFSL